MPHVSIWAFRATDHPWVRKPEDGNRGQTQGSKLRVMAIASMIEGQDGWWGWGNCRAGELFQIPICSGDRCVRDPHFEAMYLRRSLTLWEPVGVYMGKNKEQEDRCCDITLSRTQISIAGKETEILCSWRIITRGDVSERKCGWRLENWWASQL